MMKLTRAGMRRVMADLTNHTAAGNFDGVLGKGFIHLAKSAPAFNEGLAFADFDAADYTGYLPLAITKNAPYKSQDGHESETPDELEFRPSDGVTPNTIEAVLYCDDVDGTHLYAVEYLDPTVELADAMSALNYTPTFQIPLGQSWGAGDVVA